MNGEIDAAAEVPEVAAGFSAAWRLFAERFWLLMSVGGIGAAGCMLSVFIPYPLALLLRGTVPALALWTLTSLVSLSAGLWGTSWVQIAMIEAVLDPQRKPNWRECYRASWPKVAGFSWVCILFFLALTGGVFFFVLPGVFLGVALVFAPVAAVAEDSAGMAALTRSMELVSGRWAPVALRLFLAGLAAALPGLIPWIGWLLSGAAAPFAMVYAVSLYDSLRRLAPRPPPPAWQLNLPLGLAAGLALACWMAALTALKIRDALPLLEAQYQTFMDHPLDPEKAQRALALLHGGASQESLTAVYQLLQPSTATAPGTPAPPPTP